MSMSMWDSVVASASKAVTQAATQASEVTAVVATKAKLSADMLVIDRDITSRMERFGVDMYTHLEGITSTQEFYVADDRLINVIRPTLIRAQREVAAYERKRDAMRGRVDMAEAERCGTGSIVYAPTIGEKLMNAAKFAAAGAREAANKTELAMLERQILGFKEEFGTRLYPIFASMEDDEGWLPTDRKVRSLYDGAREDISKMQLAKEEKREQIRRLDSGGGGGAGGGGGGFAAPPPPAVVASKASFSASTAPTAVATPVPTSQMGGGVGIGGQAAVPWASTSMPTTTTTTLSAVDGYGSNGYGIASSSSRGPPPPPQTATYARQQQQLQQQPPSGFGFMQTAQQPGVSMMPQYHPGGGLVSSQPQQQQQYQYPTTAAFDPFDGIPCAPASTTTTTTTASVAPPAPVGMTSPYGANNGIVAPPISSDWFDSFSPSSVGNDNPSRNDHSNNNRGGGGDRSTPSLSNADLNLFKY
ncbi:hypothetical protein ACHAW5_010832 [Stephanodiscus triporus]|uniref:Uncharacterized protein n=1 Tax=Stephanodiscus triporus TaxID=2934178 RepID=A0ABD3NBL6_9STRA